MSNSPFSDHSSLIAMKSRISVAASCGLCSKAWTMKCSDTSVAAAGAATAAERAAADRVLRIAFIW